MSELQSKPTPEHERFTKALRTVLRVSHSELKEILEAEKKAKKHRRPRPSSAGRASDAKN